MALFPIFYLGPVDYYSLLLKSSSPVFEIQEHFVKQTYRNRCCIYGANGKLNLVIPVRHTGERTPMKDAKIANEAGWQKIHWRSMEAAYRTSSYFEFYEHIFAPYYEKQFDFLLDFNVALMEEVLKILDAHPQPSLKDTTASYQKENSKAKDYRNYFPVKNSTDKKILSGGETPGEIPYPQVFSAKYGFLPRLSIIDLIFNAGNSSYQYLFPGK